MYVKRSHLATLAAILGGGLFGWVLHSAALEDRSEAAPVASEVPAQPMKPAAASEPSTIVLTVNVETADQVPQPVQLTVDVTNGVSDMAEEGASADGPPVGPAPPAAPPARAPPIGSGRDAQPSLANIGSVVDGRPGDAGWANCADSLEHRLQQHPHRRRSRRLDRAPGGQRRPASEHGRRVGRHGGRRRRGVHVDVERAWRPHHGVVNPGCADERQRLPSPADVAECRNRDGPCRLTRIIR